MYVIDKTTNKKCMIIERKDDKVLVWYESGGTKWISYTRDVEFIRK